MSTRMRFVPDRRLVAIVVAVLAPAALFVAALRVTAEPHVTPVFATPGTPSMPYVPHTSFTNSTWFCGGVPIGGKGKGGIITVANPLDTPLTGHLEVYTDADGIGLVEREFEVQPRSTYVADIAELQPTGTYASAMVELGGGAGFVEQTARHADGDASGPCSNSTSDTWYFADNYTLGDSKEDIVITNPFPDDAILDFTFANSDGTRSPNALQGVPVAAHSILIVDQELLAKDEAIYAVAVHASRGRVVAVRAQNYAEERRGFSLSLGAPAPSTEWWFTGGWKDGTNFERFSIYNPGEEDTQVQPVFYGIDDPTFSNAANLIDVPAGRVVSFSLTDMPSLPNGRHGVSFTSMEGAPLVVEMAVTKKEAARTVTTVVLGVEQAFINPGFYRWSMAVGPEVATQEALLVMNLSYSDAVVVVNALGPGGEVPVPGLEAVTIPAGSIMALSIPADSGSLGKPLVVVADQPVIVERLLPRGGDLEGRSASIALPG